MRGFERTRKAPVQAPRQRGVAGPAAATEMSGTAVREAQRSLEGFSPAQVLLLQRTIGNHAVSRLVQRQPTNQKAEQEEEQFTLTGEQEPLQLESADPVRLSSFSSPQQVETVNADRGAQFGLTTSVLSFEANVTRNKRLGEFNADVKFKQLVRWETASGTGPQNQVNIPDAQAAAITGLNNHAIAHDLAPEPGNEYPGRPRRDEYWVERLTKEHELFHVAEYKKNFLDKVKLHKPKIKESVARTKPDLETHIDGVLTAVHEDVKAAMAIPGGEVRAYGAGARAYTELAAAIRAGAYAFPPLRELYGAYIQAQMDVTQQQAILSEIERQWSLMAPNLLEDEQVFVPPGGVLAARLAPRLPAPEVNA